MDNRITNLVLVNKMSLCKLVFTNYKQMKKRKFLHKFIKKIYNFQNQVIIHFFFQNKQKLETS